MAVFRCGPLQVFRDLNQQLVGFTVAIGIVDPLEAVQVDVDEGVFGSLGQCLDPADQRPPVVDVQIIIVLRDILELPPLALNGILQVVNAVLLAGKAVVDRVRHLPAAVIAAGRAVDALGLLRMLPHLSEDL